MRIQKYAVSAYKIPTSTPESDGTLPWDATILVCIFLHAGNDTGFGYTYADKATAVAAQELLKTVVNGEDPMNIPDLWQKMLAHNRNLGRPGISSMAISAIDTALWDLKAKILKLPLTLLFGQTKDAIPVYGSGGFTSYSVTQLCRQLSGWSERGMSAVKMKIGTHPQDDIKRVEAARKAIGPKTELFVDANGAYSVKEATQKAAAFAGYNVTWFEEPVPAYDFPGTKFLREHAPPMMNISSGEYGYDLDYFARLLSMGAVDFLQADATRCGGFSGFLKVAALAEAFNIPLSSHCAPTLHVPLGCALQGMRHLEYFHDHARIEGLLFDGFQDPMGGKIAAQRDRPGLGVEFKHRDAERFMMQ